MLTNTQRIIDTLYDPKEGRKRQRDKRRASALKAKSNRIKLFKLGELL